MSALPIEPLDDVNPLIQVPPGPMSVYITADSDGSTPVVSASSRTITVPGGFAGVIQLTIDTAALPSWVFLRGVAFSAPQRPPISVDPDPGPTTMTFPWLNTQQHNDMQSFSYTIYLLNTATGDVLSIDPTVENGPVG